MEKLIISKNNKQTNKVNQKNDQMMAKKSRTGVSGVGRKGEEVGWMGILGVLGMQTVIFGIEWMDNGILMYNTGKCVWLGQFVVQQKTCKSTVF